MGEMIELYKQGFKTGKVQTIKGAMDYIDWLKQERDRIGSDPTRIAEVRENKSGNRASLWVDNLVEYEHT